MAQSAPASAARLTNDSIEREEPDRTKVRPFDPENFRRRKKQFGALHWRLSKLRPKRYLW
jgi:hypothetical protein